MRDGWGAILAMTLSLASCRDPTQIRLEISTDARCTDHGGTAISVGQLGELENKPPVASTTSCDAANGRIGSLVVVPSGDTDDNVAIRVVTGVGKTAQECVDANFTGGCIVARRALHYIPNETLFLPIEMSVDCQDIACKATETCFKGSCVPATINPDDCTGKSGCVPNFDGGTSGAGGTGGIDGGSGGTGGGGGTSGSGGAGGCEANLQTDSANCGACGVSCFSAPCNAGSCEPALVTSVPGSAIAIASDVQNVYWADPNAGTLRQAPLTGGSSILLASGQSFAQGVFVDATHVYWANWTNNGRVARVPIGGGTPQVLFEPEGFPADVAVDDTHVYWTAGNSQAGFVRRILKTGGTPELLASNQFFPFGIAIDATHVYWANWTANGVINKVQKDGSGGVMPLTLVEKSPYAIAHYSGTIFFTLYNAQGQIRSAPASGTSAASALISGNYSKPTAVDADASGVWWTTDGDAVYHLPPGATEPLTIASGVTGLEDIAVGPKAVCWATAAGPVCKGK